MLRSECRAGKDQPADSASYRFDALVRCSSAAVMIEEPGELVEGSPEHPEESRTG